MSVFFTRDLLFLTGADAGNPFEVDVKGSERNTVNVDVSVPPGQFIAGASITPIQNIPNYAKTIRRLTADRVFEGNSVIVTVRGTRNESRFRGRLQVAVSSFGDANQLGDTAGNQTVLTGQAFQLWANASGFNGFGQLPPANNAHVGDVFFVRNEGANFVKISTSRPVDKIVHGANYGQESDVVESDSLAGRSIILRCVKKRSWFVECINNAGNWTFS